jgi:hypothetical protein
MAAGGVGVAMAAAGPAVAASSGSGSTAAHPSYTNHLRSAPKATPQRVTPRANPAVDATRPSRVAPLLRALSKSAVLGAAAVAPTHTYTVTSFADSGAGSLRAALAQATTDDTFDKIVLPAGTYQVSSAQLVADDPKGLEITGAGWKTTTIHQTGAFRDLQVIDGTSLALRGVRLNGGDATTNADDGDGGGIEVLSGFLKANSVRVTSTTAEDFGGGIYVAGPDHTGGSSSEAVLHYVTLRHDTAGEQGGGLDDENQVLAAHLTVTDNTATSGGGISLSDQDGVGSSLDASFVLLSANVATSNSSSAGGALNNDDGNVLLTDSTIGGTTDALGNSATYEGGGISVYYGTTELDRVTIDHNNAIYGGAIFEEYSTDVVNGATISGNEAEYGGGIYQYYGDTFQVSGTAINGNTATSEGGGVYTDYATFSMTKGSLTGNVAEPTGSAPVTYDGYGGGMYNDGGTQVALTGTSVSSNQAEYGGGIYEYDYSILSTSGVTFADNNDHNSAVAAEGGAIYAYVYDSAKIVASTFTDNTAQYGGAFYGGEYSSATVTDSAFTKNVAPNGGEGGAFYLADYSSLAMTGGTLTGNSAQDSVGTPTPDSSGGGIYDTGHTSSSLRSVIVSHNSAGFGGGLLQTNTSPTRITDSIIRDNTASVAGAGVFDVNSSTLTLVDSAIVRNAITSTSSFVPAGGGIIVGGASLVATNSTIMDNSIASTVPDSVGGGIDNEGSTTLTNVTLKGNTVPSTGHGAAIENADGELQVTGTLISGAHGKACSNTLDTDTGTVTSGGYNIETNAGCPLTGPGDQHSVHPKLGRLGKHGGTTPTARLLTGSPAIGTDAACPLPATDQRGQVRPSGKCDSGAYQYTQAKITHVSPDKGAKGRKVTITGTGFLYATTVMFGSHKAHIVSVTATKVVVLAPAGPKGLHAKARSVKVTVMSPDGSAKSGQYSYRKI